MKQIKPKLKKMTLSEKLFFYLNRFEQKRRKEVKDYAREMRKENLYNHVKKDMMSDNLYILICTVIYSLILFSFCVIAFLLACNLSVKILL
jgi:hypothetical protein